MRRLVSSLAACAVAATQALAADVPAAPDVAAKSYIVVDFASRAVLAESNADEPLHPASLTKIMTAYVVFAALDGGDIDISDPVTVSERAWRTPGSRTFIEVGSQVSVGDLLMGMIVQSGNDAAVALAEHVSGSVETFVDSMNETAARLGMGQTRYRNVTGLPARDHVSTAGDTALLAAAIIRDFPDYYGFYSEREFTYNEIRQHNRNALLWRDSSVDGLKTGYTAAAGYCLASSAERNGMRLIAVVMGMPSANARTEGSLALLNYGFDYFETHRLYARGEALTEAKVWKGDSSTIELGLDQDLYVTVPRGQYDRLSATMNLEVELIAPIAERESVGEVAVSLDGSRVSALPLVSLSAVGEAGLISRIADGLMLWFD